jgi:hypothetical protein
MRQLPSFAFSNNTAKDKALKQALMKASRLVSLAPYFAFQTNSMPVITT